MLRIRFCRVILSTSLLATLSGQAAVPDAFAPPEPRSDTADIDLDGLPDILEMRLGTDRWLTDTDGDGFSDGEEIGPDPDSPVDSDGDRRINALDVDDDGDGIPTILEAKQDSDADGLMDYLDLDADGDGKTDHDEAGLSGQDRDQDGIDDVFDSDLSAYDDDNGDGIDGNHLLPDRDRDGIPDIRDGNDHDGAAGDLDGDGLSNAEEQALGSDPLKADTDGDRVPDPLELGNSLEGLLDSDADGIPNL
ncbi:MAG: hypothetical protein R3E89_14850, partial [Thiolinea sp.]